MKQLRNLVSLTSSKAYVDTSVLTDALLKQDAKGSAARTALKRYSETFLPVYAIKEFRAGPLDYWIWLHNKLAQTKSVASTLRFLNQVIGFQVNRPKTAIEALATFMERFGGTRLTDSEAADFYRLHAFRIIMSAWKKRRTLTTKVVDELTCYVEADPKFVKGKRSD